MTLLKRAARTMLHSAGLLAACRQWHRSAVRILMYHHFFANADALKRQCEHIVSFYQPVSMGDIARSIAAGEPLPANSVAVTIDDGYRNFLTHGYPVFRSFGIPVTVYLVSDFIDAQSWLWWDALGSALQRPVDALCEQLKRVSNEERLARMKELFRASSRSLASPPPQEYAPMTWSEVRDLARDGVEFGAHTKTHPILSRINDRQSLQEEIIGSKHRIEAELEQRVIHFCYPNGRSDDFTSETVDVVAEGRFQTAVTAEPGMNPWPAAPFLLKRSGVEAHTPLPYFSELLAGVRSA